MSIRGKTKRVMVSLVIEKEINSSQMTFVNVDELKLL